MNLKLPIAGLQGCKKIGIVGPLVLRKVRAKNSNYVLFVLFSERINLQKGQMYPNEPF